MVIVTEYKHRGRPFININIDNPELPLEIREATKEGYIKMASGGIADLSFPDSKTRRGRVQDNGNICPTLTCGGQMDYM